MGLNNQFGEKREYSLVREQTNEIIWQYYLRLCRGEECNWFEQATAPVRNPNRVMRHRRLNETLAKVREE